MRINGVIAALLACWLAACSSPPPMQMAAPVPPPPPLPVLRDPDSLCRADLAAVHAVFEPLESFGEGKCSIANPVKLFGGTVPLSRPGVLSCATADVLAHFIAETMQPLARKYFKQEIKRIDHLGTFDCRARRTEANANSNLGTSKAGRLSEHALGHAIDFSGVELADGRIVSVKNDWRAGGAAGGFLHELARDSCKTFNVVLTPNHDRLHADHIHLDTGPYVLCGY